jgi:uncharacterized integral membrane protein (TIGR00698 family)
MLRTLIPGIAAAAAVAAVALAVGPHVPLAGAPVLGLAVGIAAAAVRPPGERFRPGLRFAGRSVLQAAIVLLGATLTLSQVASAGVRTLPVLVGTLAAALVAAVVGARLLGVRGPVRDLVGVGTAICGASAIAAVSPILEASEADIAYAVSTIFAFNIAAVLLFPPLGHLLGMSQKAFGLWAGTAVNDTSSVVAAGYAYGKVAGTHAVVVKLTRTTAIVPLAAVLAWRRRASVAWVRVVPWFLVLFAAAAGLRTAGLVPAALYGPLQQAAVAAITAALAGIGLSTRLGELRRAGARPLLLGALVWAAVAASALALQAI